MSTMSNPMSKPRFNTASIPATTAPRHGRDAHATSQPAPAAMLELDAPIEEDDQPSYQPAEYYESPTDPYSGLRADLRAEMAGRGLSAAAASRQIGVTSTYLSRFLSAEADWPYHGTVAEKVRVWLALPAPTAAPAPGTFRFEAQVRMLDALTAATATALDCRIIAPTGSGRTTALREYLAAHKSAQMFGAGIGCRLDWELIRVLHSRFAARGAKGPKWQAIVAGLAGRTAPLLVDDCDRLTLSGLRVLAEARRAAGASFPIFFCGSTAPSRELFPAAITCELPGGLVDGERSVNEQIHELCTRTFKDEETPKHLLASVRDAALASGLHAAMAHVRLTQWLQTQGKSLAYASVEAAEMLGRNASPDAPLALP
jgi:hypothetical protein